MGTEPPLEPGTDPQGLEAAQEQTLVGKAGQETRRQLLQQLDPAMPESIPTLGLTVS